MKDLAVSALGILLVLGLLVVQPGLFVFVLGGAAIGGIGAFVVFYRSHPRAAPVPGPPSDAGASRAETAEAPGPRTSAAKRSLVALALIAVAGVAVVAIGLGSDKSTDLAPYPALHLPRYIPPIESNSPQEIPNLEGEFLEPSVAERAVAGVPYKGDFEYEDSGEDGPHWHVEETVRIVRARFAQMSAGELAATTVSARPFSAPVAMPVRTALGPEWDFAGERARGRVLAYRRVRDLPVEVPVWPPTHEVAIGIGTIASDSLAVILVPSNGSRIDMRAPASLVRETDPPAERRQFGDEDILTVELDGLEDDADRRVLRLEIAGSIGQTSIYRAVDDLTAWTLVKLLFAGIPGTLVAFFVTRRLKRRFPDPAVVQPA